MSLAQKAFCAFSCLFSCVACQNLLDLFTIAKQVVNADVLSCQRLSKSFRRSPLKSVPYSKY